MERVIAGALPGPGFGYLLKWEKPEVASAAAWVKGKSFWTGNLSNRHPFKHP
ncbi:hypothetical protein V6R98_19490 [Agrobacterium sp. CCNWLW71]|uniref:hypothetical protein n=1 Tax=unclassified Agrobacterium TaxID=2632611 RepID=UPI0013EE2188